MTVDLDASPCLYIILLIFGKYEVLEVSLPQLNIPALLLLLGILKEVSRVSDPLMNPATAALLASTPGLTAPTSSPASPSASGGSLMAPPLTLPLILPIATVQIPMLTAVRLVPLCGLAFLKQQESLRCNPLYSCKSTAHCCALGNRSIENRSLDYSYLHGRYA